MEPTVFVIDDEPDVRASLRLLLRSLGHAAEIFGSAAEFLQAYRPQRPGCLLLDVRMPGMTGLELQQELSARGLGIPIVFISGHADVPMAVRAVKAGAVDFLEKPFTDEALASAVQRALERDREQRQAAAAHSALNEKLAALTAREREVMQILLEGAPNKIVARRLDLSVRTVEIHRARVLAKMEVDNVQQLTRLLLSEPEQKPPVGEPHRTSH